MKKIILLSLFGMSIFSSCKQSKQDAVQNFISETNKFDKEKIGQLLSDNFIYSSNTENLNKKDYLNNLDSLKKIEYNTAIINIRNLDSVIETDERVTNIIDSLLEVEPKIVQKKTYRFTEGKIKSITVDSTLNYDDYYKSLNDKTIPFYFYVQDQHDIKDHKEIYKDIKKYLTEFIALPQSDRKKFRTYANLQGTFISHNNFFHKLEFRGKKTVIISGWIASSYEIDEQYIKIRTDKSDLLLEIKDSKTLIGEGWVTGTFVKSTEK